MSLEIKNLSINVKIESDDRNQGIPEALKENVLRECRRLIEDSMRHNQER
ncbi:MAG: hypothetical protein IJ905_10145 [Fibrobacter sp.]|nr:hypothetical protein [Fibrobacter sp.]